tara:strand:+ start:2937 stop:3338 length:402 start_codon:yes stop_codon:yes gene_type:complete
VRRSPKRTYKGTRLYGVSGGSIGSGDGPPDDVPGKWGLGGNDGGNSPKEIRADVPENIQKLLEEMEESEEGQKRLALAQVRALLDFMRQDAVRRAIESAKEMMNAAHNLQDLQYGENEELIHAFFPIQPPPVD